VIVDRKDFLKLPVVEIHRIVVLHILEDINILAPDGFQYLGLDLAVGKAGEPGRDFEPGRPEFLYVSGEMGSGGDGVVDEIDPVGNIVYLKVVARCQFGGCLFKNTPVSPFKMAYDLFGKYFSAGTGENSKICRAGLVHGWLDSTPYCPSAYSPQAGNIWRVIQELLWKGKRFGTRLSSSTPSPVRAYILGDACRFYLECHLFGAAGFVEPHVPYILVFRFKHQPE
jgi:hypothetical protein